MATSVAPASSRSRPQVGRPIVDAVGLTRVFRDFWKRQKAKAVDNVDFTVNEHEIFGLLGPNGSGKSTTIKMILGLLKVTSGRLTVFGKLPSDVVVKKRIGYLPEESYMYRFLNPIETLDYYGKLFSLDAATRRRRTGELLEMVGLAQVSHRPVGEFSKGMARRLGLAQALINDPDLLILDEPTSGLDPIGTRQVKDLLLELGRRGKTIILSSHLLADVEDVCDRMVVLYGGRIRAQGTAEELLSDTAKTIIQTPRLSSETISRIEGVLEREGLAIDRVQAPRQKLEDLFMEIVQAAQREHVVTSGALHGGATAAFLRSDADGDELIEALVRPDEPVKAARAAVAPTPAQKGPREDVLKSLIEPQGDRDAAAPASVVAKAGQPSPQSGAAAAPEVDRGVLDALLGGDQPSNLTKGAAKPAGDAAEGESRGARGAGKP